MVIKLLSEQGSRKVKSKLAVVIKGGLDVETDVVDVAVTVTVCF